MTPTLYLYLLKIVIWVVFSVVSSQNLQIWMETASYACQHITLWENLFALKNTKIAKPVLTMNRFYNYDDILPGKAEYHSETEIWIHFSPITIAGYLKLNGFFCACRYFCTTCCSVRRLTTINLKAWYSLGFSVDFNWRF